jgi:asparagine synthase (glutamine-hydrolysing)
LNEQARLIAPIRMTGNFGGEVLRNVRAFKPEELTAGLFPRELFEPAKQTYNDLLRCHPVSFAVFKQCPWHHYGILALEQTQLCLRSPFLDNDLIRTLYRAPLSALNSPELSWRLIGDGNRGLLSIPTDRGLSRNETRASTAISHHLLQFLFKAEYAYDMGMPQWLAKADYAFRPLGLERLFLGRHKIFHFRTWYRGALAAYVRDTLLDPASFSRSHVDGKILRRVVESHLKGDRNYTTEIHKALTLEIIHRCLIDAHAFDSEKASSIVKFASATAAYCGSA